MSGFVVGSGRIDRKVFDKALERIKHRGQYVSGIFESDEIVMAQNYLEADGAANGNEDVPVTSASKTELRICYDGQIGNGKELAQARADHPIIRSKEELHYFRIFTEHFGSNQAVNTVGQWISL